MDAFVLAAATVLSGLSAGLFFGWRVSVIPGTKRVSAASYVETMQSVNRAILNPAFFVVFLGAPVAITVAAITSRGGDAEVRTVLLTLALALYLSTTLVTTVARNVPLNNELARFDPVDASPDSVDTARAAYERSWNRWHDLRTLSSFLAFALCVAAAVVDGT